MPAISNAPLPVLYEKAKQALAECTRIYECQTWAKKAEAMASYARQANDDSLRKMADRIQARAIRRCGELLKQIEPDKGTAGRKGIGRREPSRQSRTQVAKDAGLSEHQRKTALRVANVPEDEFEEAVQSDYPPSVTHLAEAGKKPGFKQATYAIGHLRRMVKFCQENSAKQTTQGLMETEYAEAKELVAEVDAWLDIFVTNIGD